MATTPYFDTAGEEIAHALTHGLGLVLSVGGLAVLVVASSLRGDAWHVVGCSIFGATLVLLYAASTLYHGIPIAIRTLLPRCRGKRTRKSIGSS